MASTMSFNGELLEIFAHLPVKDIAKFSCVSKSVKELFAENFFAKKQSKMRELVGDTGFIIQTYFDRIELHASSRSSIREEPLVPCSSLELLKTEDAAILSSSNGLVLCCKNRNTRDDEEHPLFLYNPATGNSIKIPLKDIGRNFVFECNADEIAGDEYLLMEIESTNPDWSDGEYRSTFYSPKEQVWKDGHIINLGRRNIMFKNAVYQGGFVYLISDIGSYNCLDPIASPWPYIVSYDIRNGVTKFLEMPESAMEGHLDINHDDSDKLKIFKFGNSRRVRTIMLVKFYRMTFTIWQLTDAENSLWRPIFKMEAREMRLGDANLYVVDFIVQNGKTLLILTDEKVYRYDFTQRITNVGAEEVCDLKSEYIVKLHSFTSTLYPCGS